VVSVRPDGIHGVLSDGAGVGPGMHITIGPHPVQGHGVDAQTVAVLTDGSFEFAGLRHDTYSVFTSVKGYDMPGNPNGTVTVKIEHDLDDFTLTLAPER